VLERNVINRSILEEKNITYIEDVLKTEYLNKLNAREQVEKLIHKDKIKLVEEVYKEVKKYFKTKYSDLIT